MQFSARHCPLLPLSLCHCPLLVFSLCHCPLAILFVEEDDGSGVALIPALQQGKHNLFLVETHFFPSSHPSPTPSLPSLLTTDPPVPFLVPILSNLMQTQEWGVSRVRAQRPSERGRSHPCSQGRGVGGGRCTGGLPGGARDSSSCRRRGRGRGTQRGAGTTQRSPCPWGHMGFLALWRGGATWQPLVGHVAAPEGPRGSPRGATSQGRRIPSPLPPSSAGRWPSTHKEPSPQHRDSLAHRREAPGTPQHRDSLAHPRNGTP